VQKIAVKLDKKQTKSSSYVFLLFFLNSFKLDVINSIKASKHTDLDCRIVSKKFGLYKIGKKSTRILPNIFDDFSVLSILFTKKCKKKCLNIKMWTRRIPNNEF
jgi:hypothetical protein